MHKPSPIKIADIVPTLYTILPWRCYSFNTRSLLMMKSIPTITVSVLLMYSTITTQHFFFKDNSKNAIDHSSVQTAIQWQNHLHLGCAGFRLCRCLDKNNSARFHEHWKRKCILIIWGSCWLWAPNLQIISFMPKFSTAPRTLMLFSEYQTDHSHNVVSTWTASIKQSIKLAVRH